MLVEKFERMVSLETNDIIDGYDEKGWRLDSFVSELQLLFMFQKENSKSMKMKVLKIKGKLYLKKN